MNTVKKENLTENLFLASFTCLVAYLFFYNNAFVFNSISIVGMFILHYRLKRDGLWGSDTNKVLFGITGMFVLSTVVIYILHTGGFDAALEQAQKDQLSDNWQLGLVIFAYALPKFFALSCVFFGIKWVADKIKSKLKG